jgi:hypothetical protein
MPYIYLCLGLINLEMFACLRTRASNAASLDIFRETVRMLRKVRKPMLRRKIRNAWQSGLTRFVLVQTYQNGKTIPIEHKIHQTAIKYTTWSLNIFHSKALQNVPKLGFSV